MNIFTKSVGIQNYSARSNLIPHEVGVSMFPLHIRSGGVVELCSHLWLSLCNSEVNEKGLSQISLNTLPHALSTHTHARTHACMHTLTRTHPCTTDGVEFVYRLGLLHLKIDGEQAVGF